MMSLFAVNRILLRNFCVNSLVHLLRTNWLLRIVFSLFNQASLANLMEKSPFFTNNSTPIYWNTGGSQQEGAFSQKLHPYHHQRPSTSDQYTQHNTLAGTFRGYPGVSFKPTLFT